MVIEGEIIVVDVDKRECEFEGERMKYGNRSWGWMVKLGMRIDARVISEDGS